jgi:putative hemolysin
MTEIALVSARKARLQERADGGSAGARIALDLAQSPDRFLSTVQIGITLIGILAGAYSGARMAGQLSAYIAAVPMLEAYADSLSLGVVVIGITLVSLVFGELVPKRIAISHPEAIATAVARPMKLLSQLALPFVWILSALSNLVLSLLRLKPSNAPPVTEQEIAILLEQGREAGVFDRQEQYIVERALQLGDLRVSSLMTPRGDILWIDADDPIGESMRLMTNAPHTYFPVCREDIDHIVGLVSVKNQWSRMVNKLPPDLKEGLITPDFVPESMSALRVLELFKHTGRHIAIVVDEYGSTSGIVTLNDILQAIVGEVSEPGGAEDAAATQRADGSWLFDGLLPIHELRTHLDIGELPGEERGEFQTLAGFIMRQLGRVPRTADLVQWHSFRFEVVDMDGHRVDKVLVMQQPAPSEAGEVNNP